MGSLSPIHWLLVILVVLLVFGPTRLAGVGKGLGEGIRSFKKGLSGDGEEKKEDSKPDAAELPPKDDEKSAKSDEKRAESDAPKATGQKSAES